MITYLLRHRSVTATLFFLALFAILWFSFARLTPGMQVNMKTSGFRIDYLLHAMAYFALMVLFALWQHTWLSSNYRWIVVAFIGLLLASGTELGQAFIPSRAVNPYDLLANAGGLMAGVCMSLIISRRHKYNINN